MKRTVTHEIKLEKSVKFILLAFAIAIFANAFDVSSPIKDAMAESLRGTLSINLHHAGGISHYNMGF
jgi:hypothetical protein